MHWFADHALLLVTVASAIGGVAICALVVAYGLSPTDPSGGLLRRAFVTRVGHGVAGACFALAAIAGVVASVRPSPATVPPPVAAALQQADADRARLSAELHEIDARLATVGSSLGDVTGRVSGIEARVAAAAAGVSARAAERDRLRARLESVDVAVRRLREELAGMTTRVGEIERSGRGAPSLERFRLERRPLTRPALPAAPDGAIGTVPDAAVPEHSRAPADAPAAPARTSKAPRRARTLITESARAPEPRSTGVTDKVKRDWGRVKQSFRKAPQQLNQQLSDFGRRMKSWLAGD